MDNFSTLIGGIAGDGINEAGMTVGHLFNRLGYRIYMYYDYPSLIRGGHNFSIVRASSRKIGSHMDMMDVLIALNQETVERHKDRLKRNSFVIYDSDKVNLQNQKQIGCALPISNILKEEGAPQVMKNTCIIGGFCKVVGIDWIILEEVLKKLIPKMLELNLKVAKHGYDSAAEFFRIDKLNSQSNPIITGNQAIGMGLIKAGLKAYISYPMTPSSGLLEFMARYAPDFGLKVIHPENEIAVMLMAQGFAYTGAKAAVGTSGGGFCLMTEGLSMAGQAEIPVAILMAQRTGPSTGLPTYTAQSDLHFILNAGQGEFPRFVVSPGDAEEAYYWSGIALNMAWKYQIPAFILSDKTVSEGVYSFDPKSAGEVSEESHLAWDSQGEYTRYKYTESGISPLAFPPKHGQVIKSDSYVHDEFGITTEEPDITAKMAEKRIKKGESLAMEMAKYETVKIYGQGKTAILCWGSNKGVCIEAAEKFSLKAIHVLVLSPFPASQLSSALADVEKIISVECNSTGQLARLAALYGHPPDMQILRYNGRPFSLEDLEANLQRVLS